MPNVFDENGLEIATLTEIVADLTTEFQNIYGSDINLSSDSPDGQLLNIFAQTIIDVLELIQEVNSSFDPGQAAGNILDQRVAINGIQRQAGTYTVTPVTVVTSASVNLYGVDQTAEPIYTVADAAGNEYQLQTTVLGLSVGSNILTFQASLPGSIAPTENTITVPVTIVLGVTSVNNPSTYTTLGVDEETDAALRIRRQRSVSLASQGYLSGLLAALENINGVSSAYVYENTTGSTDADGVPGHSIWAIVSGSGADADIANAIYTKRNAGCGMYGNESYDVTQVDGSIFTVFWDEVVSVNLFIQFTATSIDGVAVPDIAGIITGLVSNLTPTVYETIDINEVATDVQTTDPNTLVTLAGLSNGKTQTFDLSDIAASGTFEFTYDGNSSAAINWNDSIATIEGKVQGITGLSLAVVTGSIASQQLVIDLSALESVATLMFVENNSLQTGAAADITFAYDYDFQNVLTPVSKKYQFNVSSGDIIILEMLLNSTAASVSTGGNATFSALGGYGAYAFSISVDGSGGASIDAGTGVYTAGGSAGTDTILVTDVLGNTQTKNILVV